MNTDFGNCLAGLLMSLICTACDSIPAKKRNIDAASTRVLKWEKSGKKGRSARLLCLPSATYNIPSIIRSAPGMMVPTSPP